MGMAPRSWMDDLADEIDEWLIWLDKKYGISEARRAARENPPIPQQYQDWLTLLAWNLLVLMVVFLLGYGWVAMCSWASSFAREPRDRRKRRGRREEAAATGARKKRKIYCRELTPAPPQTTAYNLAVLKSLRMEEEKRTGKKLPNFRNLYRERHPCGRPLPTSYFSYVARRGIKPETHVSAPTGNRTSDPLMHRMALNHRDNYDELETFYIWIRPNGRVAEVADMQVARFPVSETATQPLEVDKKNEESKSTSDAKAVQSSLCHDGKEVDEGALKQRKPDKV